MVLVDGGDPVIVVGHELRKHRIVAHRILGEVAPIRGRRVDDEGGRVGRQV